MRQETYDKWKSIIDSYDPSKETVKDYCLNKALLTYMWVKSDMKVSDFVLFMRVF